MTFTRHFPLVIFVPAFLEFYLDIWRTTYSIKRKDSTDRVLSLKSECSSGDFADVIKVFYYSLNIAKGLSQITKKITSKTEQYCFYFIFDAAN